MKEKLVGVLAAVSLVVCVATAALWARSHLASDGYAHARNGTLTLGRSSQGRVHVLRVVGLAKPSAGGWSYVRWSYTQYDGDSWTAPGAISISAGRHRHLLGFASEKGTQDFPYRDARGEIAFQRRTYALVSVPYWPVCVLAAWPVWRPVGSVARRVASAVRGRRTERLAAGCCPACGYDLRATPDRCPECGAGSGGATT